MTGIGNKGEGQVKLRPELLVAARLIRAYANYFVPFFFQLGEIIAQVAGLDGTGGRIIFGVKIKHQLLPLELRQRHLVAILVPSRERRGLIAFL